MRTIRFIAFALAALTVATAGADPRNDAVSRVADAVNLLQQRGAAALEEIGQSNGKFHQGEAYVFVYDQDVVMVAHPEKPALVGKSFKGKPDVKGFAFRDAIVETTLSKGESWTDYMYQKPGEAGIHKKTTYCKLSQSEDRKLVVCSGVYGE